MPWSTLESVRGLVTFPCDWQHRLGGHFPPFRLLCLRPSAIQPPEYPCPRDCGCWHRIIPRHDAAGVVAACQCHPPTCPDLELTMEDITPLEVNRTRLGRAICRALMLNPKPVELPLCHTAQIGSWSADAVPAILTIQVEGRHLRTAISELALRLQRPFILLAPTTNLLDAASQELLAHAHAAFFPLETTVILTNYGTLEPAIPPGRLFASFTPQPEHTDEDLATRVMTLVNLFDAQTLTVFRLYCIQGLSAAQTARRSNSSKTAVMRRLKTIHEKTGIPAAQMRRISPHLAKLEDSISDSRARRINRQALAHDTGQTGDVEP